MKNKRKNLSEYAIWIFLLGLFVFTRVYHICILPNGIHIDEAGMAYDAWCLSQYGFDRYFNTWPLYLKNFGGGQSALYAFLCAGLFKMFGYHIFWVRLPGMVFSLITVVFGTLSVRHIYPKKKWLHYFTALLLTICPYFILASRFGLDCNLFLGAAAVFLYCVMKAQDSGRYAWYAWAGIAGGITLYTYVISYMILPLFLVPAFVYALITHKFHVKKWLVMAVPMGILAAPLIAIQLINMFDLPQMKLGIFTLTKLNFYRASEIGMPSLTNIKNLFLSMFVNDAWPYNSVPGFYLLYGITIPFFAVGVVACVIKFVKSVLAKEHKSEVYLLLWFFICLVIGTLTETNSNKINAIFFVTIYITVEGFYQIVSFVQKKKTCLLYVAAGFTLAVYTFCFVRFGMYYYGGQYTLDNEPMPYFFPILSEAVEYLEEHPEQRNLGTYMEEPGIVLAISSLYPPEQLGSMEGADWGNSYCDGYYRCRQMVIEPNYNCIVRHTNTPFLEEFRRLGYEEIVFDGYSLFIFQN